MKLLGVLIVGLVFHFGCVVDLRLEDVGTSDHLGVYQPSYEFDHL